MRSKTSSDVSESSSLSACPSVSLLFGLTKPPFQRRQVSVSELVLAELSSSLSPEWLLNLRI
jgi:hypothetical protein